MAEYAILMALDGKNDTLAEAICLVAERIKRQNAIAAPPLQQTPRARGQKAREAGLTHRVPADLRADPVAAQEFVQGWSEIAPANDMPTIDPELVAAVGVEDSQIPF